MTLPKFQMETLFTEYKSFKVTCADSMVITGSVWTEAYNSSNFSLVVSGIRLGDENTQFSLLNPGQTLADIQRTAIKMFDYLYNNSVVHLQMLSQELDCEDFLASWNLICNETEKRYQQIEVISAFNRAITDKISNNNDSSNY